MSFEDLGLIKIGCLLRGRQVAGLQDASSSFAASSLAISVSEDNRAAVFCS